MAQVIQAQDWEAEFAEWVKLPRGWDSYDAEPPRIEAIYGARLCLEALAVMGWEPQRVDPSVEGGIWFGWRKGLREASVEFYNSGSIVGLTSDNRGDVQAWDVKKADLSDTLARLRAFVETSEA